MTQRGWTTMAQTSSSLRALLAAGTCVAALSVAWPAMAETSQSAPADQSIPLGAERKLADPRAGEAAYERAQRLSAAIDAILNEAAETRGDARRLPSQQDYVLMPPPWQETKEDRNSKIKALLESALELVTDVPVVEVQKTLDARRQTIVDLKDQIAKLKEQRMTAPKDGWLPGMLTQTQDTIDGTIKDLETRIAQNEIAIGLAKGEIVDGLRAAGVEMTPAQLDLMLDSVIGADIVKLVAAFDSAKLVDQRLGQLLQSNSDNMPAARRYFGMHAALFAMLVHAQDMMIGKIDREYIPKLDAIIGDIKKTRQATRDLLRQNNRPDQTRTLEANLAAQATAEEVANYYRGYLATQRDQLMAARARTVKDLRIADNTYETVEASFQLRALIRDAASSFEALERLEAPGFDKVFENEELRREFENLTRQLAPSS